MFNIMVKDKGGKLLAKVECKRDECSVGKSSQNLVKLRGWRVAGVHAEFNRLPDGIYVEDKSQGNTTVNGEAITRYGPLRSKDEVEIGGFRISVGAAAKQEKVEDLDFEITQLKAKKENGNGAAKQEDDDEDLKTVIGMVGIDQSNVEEVQEFERKGRFMWRNRVHKELLSMMDLRRTDISEMDDDELRNHVKSMIREIIKKMSGTLPADVDKKQLATDVLNEAVGLGPLEELLADETITEVMVNSCEKIFIERSGRLQRSEVTFSGDPAVLAAIERIVSPLGRRIDESSPMVDARLKDGSRVNAIIPPLALDGPCLTIRKFSKNKLVDKDLVKFGATNDQMLNFLEVAVQQRLNIIISGGTGSGKTTLLNVLSNYIPDADRIVTVEDAAELQLAQPHVVRLEARPPNLEGKGAVPIRDLVKNCLRMRPDRIVVGECRGGEALDMLQAMNTGHDGSLTTAHANTPRDLIARLEVMVMMAGMDLPSSAIREQVASAVDIVVQQSRFADGSRKITNVAEITGVEQGIVQMQDIFRYDQEGFDEEGMVRGKFVATGAIPEFYEELRSRGIPVDMSIFKF
ncbi:MAG: ATPase, T2SS/T4P/T4SS family [Pseudomonadota bacterium]